MSALSVELSNRLQNSRIAIAVADGMAADLPLIFINTAFTSLTGHTSEQCLGQNCRFLQGPKTSPGSIAKIRRALEEGRGTTTCLVNYRRDGTEFHNLLFIEPFALTDGAQVFIGCQNAFQMSTAMTDLEAQTGRFVDVIEGSQDLLTETGRRRLNVLKMGAESVRMMIDAYKMRMTDQQQRAERTGAVFTRPRSERN